MSPTRTVIFAKAPVPGTVKTRLIPALGEKKAAELAANMLRETIEEALAAGTGAVELCGDPAPGSAAWTIALPPGIIFSSQGDGDLGERLARAARRTVEGGERVLLIGADCPSLDRERLHAAAEALQEHDAVILPARDGGYVLFGLACFDPYCFTDIPWSTDQVAPLTISRVRALGWRLYVGETLRDVDVPTDLA